jgi:hypothetical protein
MFSILSLSETIKKVLKEYQLKLKKTLLSLTCLLGLAYGSTANATLITETIDAGNTMSTAMLLASDTTSVLAEINGPTDTDLFRFTLAFNSIFTIEVLEIDDDLDMNIILFNALGQGLAGDDDDNNDCAAVSILGSLDSCLTLNLVAGDYFFAIGDNNMAAFESMTDFNDEVEFIDNDSGILATPTAEILGLVGPEGGPNDTNDVGRYRVNLIQTTAVPEPSSIILFAAGIFGMAMRRRSKSTLAH